MTDLFSKWKSGLARKSKSAFGQIATLFGATEITQETWDDLETLLIQADLGIETTNEILGSMKRIVRDQGLTDADELSEALRNELLLRLDKASPVRWIHQPSVLMVVGVNGSGKTTTIAKLAQRYQAEGNTVLFGAADTFRAAAVDQLQVWGERLGVDVVSGAPESDPGAGAFNAVQSGVARHVDLVIVDTAVGDEAYAGARNFETLAGTVTRVLGHTYLCPTHNSLGAVKLIVATLTPRAP